MNTPHTASLERQQLYRDMDPLNLRPLWEVLHALVPRQPASPCVPALWKYQEVRPWLMESGGLITAREAVRRVLILENPGLLCRTHLGSRNRTRSRAARQRLGLRQPSRLCGAPKRRFGAAAAAAFGRP